MFRGFQKGMKENGYRWRRGDLTQNNVTFVAK
jgi:hypothetical protein